MIAARAIRRTLAGLEEAGALARYHAVDVRDGAAFSAVIDAIYAREGRIDGVVHGAGVLEDKLFLHKTRESFDRVFDTKVSGARAIAKHVRPDVGFVAFFGSVAGAFGNRGQVDYAAANDALDKLAWWLDGRASEDAWSRSTGGRGQARGWSRRSWRASTSGPAWGSSTPPREPRRSLAEIALAKRGLPQVIVNAAPEALAHVTETSPPRAPLSLKGEAGGEEDPRLSPPPGGRGGWGVRCSDG